MASFIYEFHFLMTMHLFYGKKKFGKTDAKPFWIGVFFFKIKTSWSSMTAENIVQVQRN